MTRPAHTSWRIYLMAALIAVVAGGLAGRHAPPVSEARAEGVLWAAPGVLEALQEQEVDPLTAPARPLKIGFINSQAVFELHPRVPELRTALEAQLRQWQQEQADLQDRAQVLQNELRTAQLSPGQRRTKESELENAMSELTSYQTEVWGAGGRAEMKEQELMQPIIQAIDEAIKDIAENSAFDLILDAGGGGLLFGDRSLDLTRTLLEKLGIPIPETTPPPPPTG